MQHDTTVCAKSVNRRRIWGTGMTKYWMLAAFALAMASPAKAQTVPVFGVTTCGTPPTTITNGKPAYLTVLAGSGVLCNGGGSGPGGSIIVSPPSFTGSAPSGALTLASGGTSQVLFTANEVIHGCSIQNPSTATESIWVNFYTTAVGTAGTTAIQVQPGTAIGCGSSFTTAISWIAATTSHAINAVKF